MGIHNCKKTSVSLFDNSLAFCTDLHELKLEMAELNYFHRQDVVLFGSGKNHFGFA